MIHRQWRSEIFFLFTVKEHDSAKFKISLFSSMFGTKESLKIVYKVKNKIFFCKTIKEFKDKPEQNFCTV